MGHVTWSHLVFMALLEMLFLLTDGGNLTWLEPLPVETVTDASSVSTTTKQVIQGSLNEELSCKFSLTSDMNTTIVLVKVRGHPAVNVHVLQSNVSLRVEPHFTKSFSAVWVPNKLMLIFFNVTDAEDANYTCEVITVGRSARHWTRKIQLVVLDPTQAMVPSITVPQNPIQTTVPAITASEDPRQTMIFSNTGSQSPIPTTEPAITASKDGNLGYIIGIAIGVFLFFCIVIATVCCVKPRVCRRSPTQTTDYSTRASEDNHQRNEGVAMQVQDSYALLEPRAADGINCNQSKMDIQGEEEDTSV